MIDYQAHLETAQKMNAQVTAEIERLTRVHYSLLGQIDLLQQFIRIEANDAILRAPESAAAAESVQPRDRAQPNAE